MTHSLHRFGPEESFEHDYVVLIRPAIGVNSKGAAPKIRRVLQLVYEHGPTNMGCVAKGQSLITGLDVESTIPEVQDNWPIFSVFSDRQKLASLLKQLKEEDIGLSVTVSGVVDQVEQLAASEGLRPHSAHFSLGIHGDKKKLAADQDLEITTMCGHGLVAARLVQHLREEVAAGRISAEEAARQAARPCSCGIFNTERAKTLFEQQAHECRCAPKH
jgi:hypothetical protein